MKMRSNIIETVKFKPVALPCGKKGSTRLYTTNLFTGGCPHSCAYCYASGFKNFSSQRPTPVPMEAIKNVRKWPRRLFLSSASDPFHPVAVKLTEELLRSALSAGTFVVISTKALATAEIVKILSRYAAQVSYTVSLTSLNENRNRILEPNAPNAKERLYGKRSNSQSILSGIEQLARNGLHVTLKADTIFPGLDDTDENIARLLKTAKSYGAQAVTLSYAFYRNRFKKKLINLPLLQNSLSKMNENQPIASGMGFSLPLRQKKKRLAHMAQIANDIGYQMISTCACKNRIESLSEDIPMQLDCHFHDKWF
jgi:DNA repair photolyase